MKILLNPVFPILKSDVSKYTWNTGSTIGKKILFTEYTTQGIRSGG